MPQAPGVATLRIVKAAKEVEYTATLTPKDAPPVAEVGFEVEYRIVAKCPVENRFLLLTRIITFLASKGVGQINMVGEL